MDADTETTPDLFTLPSDARDVLVSVNPRAGARSGVALVDELVARLQAVGLQVQRCADIEQLGDLAAARQREGRLRAVVAAGGDGTVQLVVNRTPPGTPLAILPLGTDNLLAKYLGLTANPDALCQLIQAGTAIRLDAGQANARIFLLMVGCGFDGGSRAAPGSDAHRPHPPLVLRQTNSAVDP